jgi:hypothetical protein
MSDWLNLDENFASDPTRDVEDLMRFAADDVPALRSGLRVEIVTRAQNVQREVRAQHMLWGCVTSLLILAGTIVWWPASSTSVLAKHAQNADKPVKASLNFGADAIDWDLVESKTELRRRNLESLRNAF